MNSIMTPVTIQALDPESLVISYDSYTDSVSDGYGETNLCGPIAHWFSETSSTLATLSFSEGSSTFEITYDASSQADAGTFEVTLHAQMTDYPSVTSTYQTFEIVVDPADEPWIPPEPEPEIEPVVQPIPEIVIIQLIEAEEEVPEPV